MRKFLSISLLFVLPLLGCTKSDSDTDSDSNPENPIIVSQDDYYVKYHFIGDGNSVYCSFDIKFINSVTSNSDPALHTLSYRYPKIKSKIIEDEVICGPFKKNDKAYLEMYNESSVYTRKLEIYVSKNSSPFALRKSTNESKLEYIIDY